MNSFNPCLVTLLLVSSYFAGVNSQRVQFNKKFVGVAFSPYTDNGPKENRKKWDQYSAQDLTNKLNTVRTRFSEISTYSMGVNNNPACIQNYENCASNAKIAKVAAQINSDNRAKTLSVNIGVYQSDRVTLQREVDNAIQAAKDANSKYPNTVWGIAITNEYVFDAATGQQVLDLINYAKERAPAGVKIGTRVNTCEQIYSTNGNAKEVLGRIASASGFIYCNHYPATGAKDPVAAASEVGKRFLDSRAAFRKINPSLDVRIGETGWPSALNSFNLTDNNKKNLIAYWTAMNDWATKNAVQVQMFSAIDEPWKGEESKEKYLGESYYGWWNKPDNNQDTLVEKF